MGLPFILDASSVNAPFMGAGLLYLLQGHRLWDVVFSSAAYLQLIGSSAGIFKVYICGSFTWSPLMGAAWNLLMHTQGHLSWDEFRARRMDLLCKGTIRGTANPLCPRLNWFGHHPWVCSGSDGYVHGMNSRSRPAKAFKFPISSDQSAQFGLIGVLLSWNESAMSPTNGDC